jgi:ornithine decarboxylase
LRTAYPAATLAFMHPIKPREAIAEAYADLGVRIFSLDSAAELDKIVAATGEARDLTLCVRMTVDNSDAKLSLGAKFGIAGDEAVALLRRTRQSASRLGICFHVGSQTMTPGAYTRALKQVRDLVVRSGVFIDIVDVGGGFPVSYPGMEPPAPQTYVDEIVSAFETFPSVANAELWCEPGRALCAEAASILLRVDGRKGQDLYVNDGAYGTLFDAGQLGWRFPSRTLRRAGHQVPFSFYGPTCDDADYMPGPFFLPAETGEGDLIEVGMIGAYGRTMAGQFNGFGAYEEVACADDPFGTIYQTSNEAIRVEGF